MTSEIDDLSEVNEQQYTINKQRLLETVCGEYRVKRLELVSLRDEGPLEVDERNTEPDRHLRERLRPPLDGGVHGPAASPRSDLQPRGRIEHGWLRRG